MQALGTGRGCQNALRGGFIVKPEPAHCRSQSDQRTDQRVETEVDGTVSLWRELSGKGTVSLWRLLGEASPMGQGQAGLGQGWQLSTWDSFFLRDHSVTPKIFQLAGLKK